MTAQLDRRPVVALGSTGGTITMTSAGSGALEPRLAARDLVDSVPGLDSVALLQVSTLATKPGASLALADVVGFLAWAEEAVTLGAGGVVLVQGTDTLEETSFLLDLYWQHPEPLVLTGAMRGPLVPGSDGPANLLDATRVAASPSVRDLGALVVLSSEIHAARRVHKTHASSVSAFTSANGGPIGRVDEHAVRVFNRAGSRPPPLCLPALEPGAVVYYEATLGDDGALLDALPGSGVGGLVVGGFGVGHVSARVADRLGELAQRMPVVLTSRTGGGGVHEATYGFPGSERDLLSRGLVGAGFLSPRKARLLLWAGLAGALTSAELAVLFRRHGAP